MSDFFSRLENELTRAAERRAARRRLPQLRWTRRTALVLIPATVLIAVPAFAAVSGVFQHHRQPVRTGLHGPVPNGGVIDLNPPCVVHAPLRPSLSRVPPADGLLSTLAVLRRPQRPADRNVSRKPIMPGMGDGVNLGYVRLLRAGAHNLTLSLYPAESIHPSRPFPDTPACRAERRHPHPAVPGVCVVLRYSHGATGGCADIADLRRRGVPAELSLGGPPHRIVVAGVVPDGVTRVTLTFRGRRGNKRLDLPVASNAYVAVLRRNGLSSLPRVVWHGPSGSRIVTNGEGPHKSIGAMLRREIRLDRAATRVPAVLPRVGTGRSTFTMRVRPPMPRSRNGLYVITLRGPNGNACSRPARTDFGARPDASGRRKGVIEIPYGAAELGGSRWCPGTYRGTIELWPHGFHRGAVHRLYGRFEFKVR